VATPWSEIPRRRALATLGGAGLLTFTFFAGRSTSRPPDTPTPSINPPTSEPINPTFYTQQMIEAATPRPTLPPASTATAEPRPTGLPKVPIASPTIEKQEVLPKKLWEITIQQSQLGLAITRVPTPNFQVASGQLFVTDTQGMLTEIDVKTGRPVWQWTNKGIPLAYGGDILYVLHGETPRIYAIGIPNKQEVDKFNLPESLVGSLNSRQIGQNIKFPIITKEKVAYLEMPSGTIGVYPGTHAIFPINNRQVISATKTTNLYKQVIAGTNSIVTVDYLTSPNSSEQKAINTSSYAFNSDYVVITEINTKPESGSVITGVKLIDGASWTQNFESGWKPVHVGKDFVVIEKRQNREPVSYKLLGLQTGDTVMSFDTDSSEPHNVMSFEGWILASHAKTGTIAFKDGRKMWVNDEVLGALRCVAEVGGNLILTRGGVSSGTFGEQLDVTGTVWALDGKTGKLSWRPIQFDKFTANSIRIGDKLVIADGIAATRFALNTVDLKTGKKTIVDSSLNNPIMHLSPLPEENVVLGEIIGGKLFAFRF
jgi:hypothetical protein